MANYKYTVPDSYLSIKNPTWNPDGSIDVTVTMSSLEGDCGYTACEWGAANNDPTSSAIFERAKAGEYGEVGPTPQALLDLIKTCAQESRDNDKYWRIEEASRVCQPMAEEKDLGIISDEDLARYRAWAVYRQKLRKVDTSIENPAWPEKPE